MKGIMRLPTEKNSSNNPDISQIEKTIKNKLSSSRFNKIIKRLNIIPSVKCNKFQLLDVQFCIVNIQDAYKVETIKRFLDMFLNDMIIPKIGKLGKLPSNIEDVIVIKNNVCSIAMKLETNC